MDVQVRKKDGQLEAFDRNKILNGLLKSGASQPEAESVTAQVETWVLGVALGGVVNSSDLKSRVLGLLRAVNPSAAATFESYQKPTAPAEGVGGPMEPPPSPPPPPGTPASPPPAI